ncbi:MAG: hypothetical protein ACKV19_23210 [Verrucomicrobiales bacterium]
MSAPPSQAKPPGDDFVLWPEGVAQGVGRIEASQLQRVLDGLAPEEWVEEPEAESEGRELEPPDPVREARFYPASRQWFRTTAAIPATDSNDKWWVEPPEASPSGGSLSDERDGQASVEDTSLLSPEEIWELAAEELEQASRLRAPVAPSAQPPTPVVVEPSEPQVVVASVPAAVPSPSVVAPLWEPVATPPPSVARRIEDVPSIPEPSPVEEALSPVVRAAAPPASVPSVPAPSASTLREAAHPAPLPSTPAKVDRANEDTKDEEEGEPEEENEEEEDEEEDEEEGDGLHQSALGLPVRHPPQVAEEPSLELRSARNGEPVKLSHAGAQPPITPVIPFPGSPFLEVGLPPRVTELPGPRSAELPEKSDPVEASGGVAPPLRIRHAGTPPGMLDPLPVIPVVSRPPVARRDEATGTTLPTQRRTTLPPARDPAAPLRGIPSSPPWDPVAGRMETDEVETGDHEEEEVRKVRRRRRRADPHSKRPLPGRSRWRWVRWVASVLGLMVVAAGVAAIIGRDHLPADWSKTANRWWLKAHQLVFPHQFGRPRRGVQPRTGQESPGAAAPGNTLEAENVGALESPVAATPDEIAAAPPPAPSNSMAEPVGPKARTPDAPSPPPTVPETTSASPPPSGDAIPVLRAEPVEEGDLEVPEAPPESGESGDSPTASDPELPMSLDSRSATASAFDLWEGDKPPGEVSVAGGSGAPTPVSVAPAPASAEVLAAQRAVRGLVAARSVAEVLPWIFDASALEPTVRSYHAQHVLEPMVDAVTEHEYSGVISATGRTAHIFNVLGPSHPRGFPVSAESTANGYRIDWQSYIQWRDAWLRRFLDSQATEPQTLFVVLRRTHYFNDDVTGLDDKHAFRVTSAVPDDEGAVAFVDKKSAVGRSLNEVYEWRTLYFPVVELQWVPATGGQSRYLRLNRIVRPTWRRLGE